MVLSWRQFILSLHRELKRIFLQSVQNLSEVHSQLLAAGALTLARNRVCRTNMASARVEAFIVLSNAEEISTAAKQYGKADPDYPGLLVYLGDETGNTEYIVGYELFRYQILHHLKYDDLSNGARELAEQFRDGSSLADVEMPGYLFFREVNNSVYAITPEGHEELLRWLSDGEPSLDSRSHILMRVFFLGERSREDNIRYFEGLKEYCRIFLQNLDAAQEHVGEYRVFLDDPEKAAYWEMTIDFGRRNMRTYMDWAQSCIDRLKGGT